MHNHKFGIVTSFYNSSRYVDKVIESIKNQTYQNWLYFVTDDFSNDDTKEKILKHCDNKKIFYVDQKFKKEMFWQPQRFVTEDCDFVITMDSDDYVYPKALQIYNNILNKYEKENIVFISTEATWYGDDFKTLLNGTFCHYDKPYSIKDKHESNNPEKTLDKKSPNTFGSFRGIKNIKNLDFEVNSYNAAGNNDILHTTILQNYGNSILVKRNLYDYNYRTDSISHKILSSEEWDNVLKIEDILIKHDNHHECKIVNNKFKNLYTDFNSFSLLNSNKSIKDNARINLITKYINKDFSHLYYLYPDYYIDINNYKDDFDYYVFNLSDYDLFDVEEFKKIIFFLKNKNFNKIFFYYYDNRSSDDIRNKQGLYLDKLYEIIFNNFGTYFWSSYYRHFTACFEKNASKNTSELPNIINESGSLGDSLAWIPMVNEYAKKNKTKVNLFTPYSYLFKDQYPLINFFNYKNKKDFADDKAIELGCFENQNWQNYTLQKIASNILKLDYKEIKPKINFNKNSKPNFDKKYICIATQSTAQCKYWNNPNGWRQVVDYLKSLNYDVVCIDRHPVYGWKERMNHIPENCINKTGDFPLEERINDLIYCEFFIGLGSGLSWLAWACDKPVVMISGFSDPKSEFYTPYRVHNKNVCNSCWNDQNLKFDPSNWLWCPRNKNFECSKEITFEMVKEKIDNCIKDLK